MLPVHPLTTRYFSAAKEQREGAMTRDPKGIFFQGSLQKDKAWMMGKMRNEARQTQLDNMHNTASSTEPPGDHFQHFDAIGIQQLRPYVWQDALAIIFLNHKCGVHSTTPSTEPMHMPLDPFRLYAPCGCLQHSHKTRTC